MVILLDAEQGMCEQIMIVWGPLITIYSFPASTRCSSKAVKLMYASRQQPSLPRCRIVPWV